MTRNGQKTSGSSWLQKRRRRQKGREEEADAADEEEDKGELPDIVAQHRVLSYFGEGLTETEAFRVMVALKRLLDREPLAKIRFWGKIFGIRRNYYVAEAKIDESRVPEKEAADEEPAEQTGKPPESIYQVLNAYRAKETPRIAAEDAKGVNEFKYYVATSDDLSEWVQLPDVLPSHINAARLITKFMTGHLDAPVECHPPFPGVERHYLRAQIARISHATIVAPKDIFQTEQPEEEEDEDGNKKPKRFEVKPYEEVPPLNPTEAPDGEDAEAVAPLSMWFYGYKYDELLEAKNWAHLRLQILKEGRATKYKPEDEEPDPDADEDGAAQPEDNEFVNPFLADLGHDRPLRFEGHSKENFHAWSLRKAFHHESSTTRTYIARSLLWPGAMCYAEVEDNKPGARFESVYVGSGVKNLCGRVYAPTLPPTPCTEFPTVGLRLQKDCTRDDELEFEPLPPAPKAKAEEGEEGADEDQ